MGIFRAVGMGIAIVILKFLLPGVVSGFENTLSAFFGAAEHIFMYVEHALPS